MVTECTTKRIGDLPFDFVGGTCGLFIIDSSPAILLCFDNYGTRKCRSLTRRNDGALGNINNFVFENEFEIDKITIPDSTHYHFGTTMANYIGFPLILGDWYNNKLEILNTIVNPPRWVEYEGTDYPYSNT